ncbi:tetratricopeptide repeat protein [Anabaenopsis sp. FSS-46]|uniref:tetratricopeptide repeat protein n=1 Tax=Anabaenopsis sp. FSS-46 TaxID=2971766 RepID=UPI00247588FB|nr:tetratricopeptide repeat protein [Anabaenopsis sp. FSS-46]MDH6100454.1 tetratricopeptide repeat protein [Anabaenopsis sp. FSS-46]
MQLIGLTRTVALTTLTFTLSATASCSQTNGNSFKDTPTPDSQGLSNRVLAVTYTSEGSNVFYGQGNLDLALFNFNQAITIDPNYALAYILRGSVYRNQQNWDLALADYNKAIELDPNNALAYTGRGNLYADQEKWDLVLADFNQAITIDPNYAGAYIMRGNIYRDLGDINKARENLQRAAQLYHNQGDTAGYERAIMMLYGL